MRKYGVLVISIVVAIVIAIISLLVFNSREESKKIIFIKIDNQRKISMEDYMCDVIINEMDEYSDYEVLKAFCIVVRTNIICSLLNDEDNVIDKESICIPYNNPKLDNKNIRKKVKEIIDDTKGEVAIYNNRIVNLPYHKISSGRTVNRLDNGEIIPYLKSVDCSKDIENKNYLKILYYDLTGNNQNLRQKIINEVKNTYERCTVEEIGDRLRIVEQGEGHNYGMSLYNAYKLSKEGYTYKEILKKYYNIKIVRIYG